LAHDQHDGGRYKRALQGLAGFHALAPGETKTVKVAVGSLPMGSEQGSSELIAEAHIDREHGPRLSLTSPSLYYHVAKDGKGVHAYGVRSLVEDFRGGAVDGTTQTVSGFVKDANGSAVAVEPGAAEEAPSEGRFGLGQTTLTFSDSIDTDAEVPEPPKQLDGARDRSYRSFQLCTHWKAQFTDAGFGEDYLATQGLQDVDARYAYAGVRRTSDGAFVWTGSLSYSGCTPMIELPPGSYELLQHSIMYSASKTFFVYHDVGSGQQLATITTPFSLLSQYYSWYSTTQTFTPSYHQPVTRVSGVVGHVLSATDNGIVDGNYTVYANTACPGKTYSCYRPGDDSVYIETNDSNWKIIIAHELGHNIESRAIGDMAHDYTQTPIGGYCDCAHVVDPNSRAHCLQSREQLTAAQMEGFAQFMAAKTFNSQYEANCGFAYYKEFKIPMGDFGKVLSPPLARDCRTNQLWMETHCPTTNRGVEWDWQIFLWNVNTNSPYKTMMAELWSIYRSACGGTSCQYQEVSWSELDDAAETYHGSQSDEYVHFATVADAAGVNN
ncbi:MAG: hypothetical protein ACOC1F_11775, partial [Myxococcota bacterium]